MFPNETEHLRKVMISMAKKYKKKYNRLEERYKIHNEHMLDITDDNKRYLNELRYLEAFIDWKNLNWRKLIREELKKMYHSSIFINFLDNNST